MWNTSSRNKRKSLYGDDSQPAWNKEEQHAHAEALRRQLESGQLDGRKPRGPSWPFTIIGVLLIIAAFGLLIFGVFEIRKQQTGGEWRAITAHVTATSISHYWDDKSKKTKYQIDLKYTYTVNGRNYTYLDYESDYLSAQSAEKNSARFMGQTKGLWYNPDAPAQSTFFPVVAVLSIASIVGAAVALIAGIFFFLQGDPRPQRFRPQAN